MWQHTREEAQLRHYLRGVALASALLGLAVLVGIALDVSPVLDAQPLFAAGSVAGLWAVALTAWFASGDVRRFRVFAHVLAGGLIVSALAILVLSLVPMQPEQGISGGTPPIPRPDGALGSTAPLDQGAAPIGAAVLGVVALLAIALLRRATPAAPIPPWMTEKPLTLPERIARIAFGLFGVGALAFAIVGLVLALASSPSSFFFPPLLVGGAIVGPVLFGVLALFAARDIRQHEVAGVAVAVGSALAAIALGVALLGSGPTGELTLALGTTVLSIRQLMVAKLALDVLLALVFGGLLILAGRTRLDYLGFLGPLDFRTVEALADSLVNEDANAPTKVPPHEVALRLDRYLSSFPSTRLRLTRLAFFLLEFAPLTWLQPPLSLLAPALRREFIDRLYKRDISNRRRRHPVLDLMQAAMRLGMQGVYVGYYSDPRVEPDIGYVRFSQRYTDYDKIKPIRKYPPLQVTTPNDLRRQGIDVVDSADVVIVGSGAAGAILAEQLANQGRDVLLLEKGLYVHPDDFTEDEIDMTGRLYSDGALQTAQSYRFQIIQGSCVGGSTVVNNAVCFDTPDRILDLWNDPKGANAGLDVAAFRQAQAAVRERLAIQSVRASAKTRPVLDVVNPGHRVIADGLAKVGLKPEDEFEIVEANIVDCLGCGYCNVGCKFGRKLSMLDEVLPKAQRDHGADRFRIISEAQAVKLDGSGGKVREIVVVLRDGRQLRIRNPKTVVVSGGAIASSWLLMRSGIGSGELPVGRHLCFNLGSPLYGYWPPANGQHLNSYAGLQISHYLKLADHPGFVCEAWYNPPVAQAMAMPGWLDRHTENMRRYSDTAAVGVLVGTEANAYVTPALLLAGAPDVVYQPTERDLKTLVQALTYLGEVMFAGGAQEVLAPTVSYKDEAVFRKPSDLPNLYKLVQDDRDLVLGSGHPQGGNAMSKTRGQDRGVVGPDFRVHGYANLYVCDASVFPSATTVNPQLTVMTMAHYAAQFVE